MAQINATLSASKVTYAPTANFSGAATLTMTTSDGGNTGSGGARPTRHGGDQRDRGGRYAGADRTVGQHRDRGRHQHRQHEHRHHTANLVTAVGLTAGTLDSFRPGAQRRCRRPTTPARWTAFNGGITNYHYSRSPAA